MECGPGSPERPACSSAAQHHHAVSCESDASWQTRGLIRSGEHCRSSGQQPVVRKYSVDLSAVRDWFCARLGRNIVLSSNWVWQSLGAARGPSGSEDCGTGESGLTHQSKFPREIQDWSEQQQRGVLPPQLVHLELLHSDLLCLFLRSASPQ
ncbi:hypothetical protein HJG60_010434 [Phyllostomus discolor]|uniref:Uncharacterized protein n=1 Tax=Phyllostomus discolor TaxID=89673 RepID=A0A834ANQ8_9CHIR|nr:hypothetical protein HJG60_010434 [Phyllostomus discolor]